MTRLAVTIAVAGLMFSTSPADAGGRRGPQIKAPRVSREARVRGRASAKRVTTGYLARKAAVQPGVALQLKRSTLRGIHTSGGMRRWARYSAVGTALTTATFLTRGRAVQTVLELGWDAMRASSFRTGLAAVLIPGIAAVHFYKSAKRERKIEAAKALSLALQQDVIENGARFGSEGVPSALEAAQAYTGLGYRPSLEIRDQILGQSYGLPSDEIPQGFASDALDVAQLREIGGAKDPWADARAFRQEVEAARRSGPAQPRKLESQADFDAVFESMTSGDALK